MKSGSRRLERFLILLPLLAHFSLSEAASPAGSKYEAEVIKLADGVRDEVVELRRDFHRHPELSNREERTSQIVAQRLQDLGLTDVRTNVAHHGVVALLKGDLPGPVVAYRADMDALPITETNHPGYQSTVAGVMHACGHDAHTAIGLGIAEVLSKMKPELHGSVKFVFQPAEEGPPPGEEGGAKMMIKEGALENPKPSAIFGLHTTPEIETGLLGYRAGSAQASADFFTITIHGKMAHAAMPQLGVDTIVVAAECISALQTIKSRRVDTFEPVIVTIGTIHGGNRLNIIPAEVKMEGTVRTLNEATRSRIEQLMRDTLTGVTSAYGATYDLVYDHGTMVVYNDPALVEESLSSLRLIAGTNNVFEAPKRMGAEDFSFFQQVVPGFFVRLGSGNKAKGITADAHTPAFDIDERCLDVGVKAMAEMILDYGERHAGRASGH
jgi:amidohydrolase